MTFQQNSKGSPVYLNIYDIIELNYWLHPFGLGAYHTSITVNSQEYYFGQHPYKTTGISYNLKSQLYQPVQPNHIFREQKYLGNTDLNPQEIDEILKELGNTKFTGNKYNLTRHNCNNFSQEFAKHLLNKDIVPTFINRLACIAECFKCLWEGHNGDIIIGGRIREKITKLINKQKLRNYTRIPDNDYTNV